MGAMSRNKGAVYEREVATALEDLTGIKWKRNLEQVRAEDQSDLTPDNADFPFVLECKRYAKGNGCKPAWQAQASAAAAKLGKLPAVVFRFDGLKTRVAIPFSAVMHEAKDFWFETDLPGFAYLAVEMMAEEAMARAAE